MAVCNTPPTTLYMSRSTTYAPLESIFDEITDDLLVLRSDNIQLGDIARGSVVF